MNCLLGTVLNITRMTSHSVHTRYCLHTCVLASYSVCGTFCVFWLAPLRPPWSPCCATNVPRMLLPQGLCPFGPRVRNVRSLAVFSCSHQLQVFFFFFKHLQHALFLDSSPSKTMWENKYLWVKLLSFGVICNAVTGNIFIHSANTYKVSILYAKLLEVLGIQQWIEKNPCSHGVYILPGETDGKHNKSVIHVTCQKVTIAMVNKWSRGREVS